MTKLKLATILVFTGIITATAQKSNAIQKVYDMFSSEENVMAFSMSKHIEDAIDTEFEWGEQLKNLEGDITKMSTMIVSESDKSNKMLNQMRKKIKSLGYKKMDLPDEADIEDRDRTFLFTRGKNGRYSEIHLLIIDEDGSGVLVSLFGDFNVTKA